MDSPLDSFASCLHPSSSSRLLLSSGMGLQRKLLFPHLFFENTPLTRGRWILFPFPYLKTPISTKTLGKGTGKASLQQWGHHSPGLAMRNPLHHRQETQDCLCQSPGVPIHCSLMLPTGREEKLSALLGRRSRFQGTEGDNCLYNQGTLGKGWGSND